MYHLVQNFKDRFGIHVNTKTVATSLDIGTYTTCLHMHLLRIIRTLRRYNDSSGSRMLVHTMVVLQIGATSSCCLLPVVIRLFAQGRESLVFALCCGLSSCFNETFCSDPFRYSRCAFFPMYSLSFRLVFLQPEPSLDWYETTKNDSTSDVYVWYVCTSIYWNYTTTLQQCCCMWWVRKK